jgi:hypothetical protein
MSDEPDRSLTWIISSPILVGVGVGFIIAMLHPESMEFSLECASLGALIGLAVGIATWLLRRAS